MLTHLASRLFGTPLLVHRAKLDVILSVLSDRIGIAAPPVSMAVPAARPVRTAAVGIAVISIHGTLVKRTAGLEAASGLTSYTEIAAMLDAAVADSQVAGILLDVDSHGGEASGCFDLARRIRAAASVKPVWAVANDSAFSAAYALASSALRVFVSETSGVGSVGVMTLHVDQSVKDAQAGCHYTAITAGSHKNDASPHQPLADAARGEIQVEVDRLYGLFVDHVAAMRGLPANDVRDTEAGLFFGANAIAAGLADASGTFDSALYEFSFFLRSRKSPLARGVAQAGAAHSKEIHMETPELTPEMIGRAEVNDLVAETRREVAQSAQAIAQMCLIANVPDKAAGFIAAGKTEAEVRQALIEARAAQSEVTDIRSTITAEAGTAALAKPETSPIVAAVKKLIRKESHHANH